MNNSKTEFINITNPRYKLQIVTRNSGTLLIMHSANLSKNSENIEESKKNIVDICEKLIKDIGNL